MTSFLNLLKSELSGKNKLSASKYLSIYFLFFLFCFWGMASFIFACLLFSHAPEIINTTSHLTMTDQINAINDLKRISFHIPVLSFIAAVITYLVVNVKLGMRTTMVTFRRKS